MMRGILALFFIVSGATGLIYQVIWAKYLALALGNTAHAHTIVLATFLAGLALGNAYLGRQVDAHSSPLKTYGWLELGIGGFSCMSPLLLSHAGSIYSLLAGDFGITTWLLSPLKFGLCAVTLLVPTFLMGGTLPCLTRFITHSMDELETSLAWLYFLNSAGAALGAISAAVYLIPALGLDLSVTVTAALNLLIGLVCIRLASSVQAGPSVDAIKAERPSTIADLTPSAIRLVLLVVFLSGVVSLCYEIAWIRLLSLVLGSSTYSFSLMVAAFITGIALGSYAVQRGVFASIASYPLFGLALLGVSASILLSLPLYEKLPWTFLMIRSVVQPHPMTFAIYQSLSFSLCVLVMLIPTTFLGMTLPLATRSITHSMEHIGGSVGTTFSINTVGNVVGALIAGLVLLPLLGIQNLILLGASIHALLGTLILLRSKWLTTRFASRLVVGFLAVVGIYLGCGGPWDKRVLTSGSFYREPFESYVSAAEYKRGFKSQDLLFYEDDANATISVHEYQSGTRVLRVNGKADASSTGDLPTQVLLGQLPMLLRPDSERVLLIGLGSGVTAGSILLHPIAQLETIEISRAVAQASEYFAPVQMAELNDPRHTVVFEDAKSYLQLTPVGLDVVISEPSNPWIAGIGNLFSIEFYTAVAARLKPDGLMVQWIHSYSLNDDLLRLILRTFTSVFPEVSVWSTISNDSSGGDYILIGSRQPIEPDFDAISELFRSEPTKRDLKRLGINTLPTLLSLQTLDSQQVASLISDGALNSDRFPLLEYSAPKALFAGEKAELFSKNDIRLQHLKDPRLILSHYLNQKARALTSTEYADLVRYHARYGSKNFVERLAYSWYDSYPDDEHAIWTLVQLLRSAGRLESAMRYLEELLDKSSEREQYLGTLRKLRQQLKQERDVYIGRSRSE